MNITRHIPASDQYPGMVEFTENGRTFQIHGIGKTKPETAVKRWGKRGKI